MNKLRTRTVGMYVPIAARSSRSTWSRSPPHVQVLSCVRHSLTRGLSTHESFLYAITAASCQHKSGEETSRFDVIANTEQAGGYGRLNEDRVGG